MPPENTLANSEAARSATGELLDQSKSTPETQSENTDQKQETEKSQSPDSSQQQTTKTEEKKEGEKPSLLNEKDGTKKEEAKPAGAPEKYEAFKAPEGFELDAAAIEKASPLFKELGLSQDQAQKLVDLYSGLSQEFDKAAVGLWEKQQADWVKEVKAHPEMGPKIAEIKQVTSRAIDAVLGAELAPKFKEAMDFTGAGNNPAFIEGFWKMAQALSEGTHIEGGKPSPLGQDTKTMPRTGAQALYPNLPSSA